MTFSLIPLRIQFCAAEACEFRKGTAANLIRGQIGKILWREHPESYERYFAPVQYDGPSGFRNAPRPFVLRVAHLEGVRLEPGASFALGVNLFEVRDPPLRLFEDVLSRVACESLGKARLQSVEGTQFLQLSLEAAQFPCTRVRVEFRTPTELKDAVEPDFCTLFARIRDRLSLLRTLYGEGPLEIDFRAMGERARSVRLAHYDLHNDANQRRSRSGTHPLGGFVGTAEYEGDLREFLPYLQAAAWTGVGRQTVWGKGEISCAAL